MDKQSNFVVWINEMLEPDEIIEAVKMYDCDIMTWKAAYPLLDKWFENGSGGASGYPYLEYAWSNKRVFLVEEGMENDIYLLAAPRNPTGLK